jgi:hypothetical protein
MYQFSPQESGSDFASVVHVTKRLAPWRKLNDKDPLALLHAKFWGKSMAIEEQEWLRAQSHDSSMSGDDPMEEDVDDDLDEDVYYDLDETDDVIPGCCLLDVGGDLPKIWVRADYIRIYDFLEAHYKKSPAPSFRAPAAVVTGQPGIGQFRGVFV